MKKEQKKPIVITLDNPDYAKFGETFGEIKSMKKNLLESLKEEFTTKMSELEEKESTTWKMVEARLVHDKLIADPSVNMSYENGVIYQEPESIGNDLPEHIKKLMSMFH